MPWAERGWDSGRAASIFLGLAAAFFSPLGLAAAFAFLAGEAIVVAAVSAASSCEKKRQPGGSAEAEEEGAIMSAALGG